MNRNQKGFLSVETILIIAFLVITASASFTAFRTATYEAGGAASTHFSETVNKSQ